MGLPLLIILFVLLGAGIVVGLVFCVVAAVLLAAGVVSVSAVVGVLRGSVVAGLRAFLWQAGAFLGMIAGIVIVAAVRLFSEIWHDDAGPWIGGALGGMAGGLLVALLVDFFLRRLAGWLERIRA